MPAPYTIKQVSSASGLSVKFVRRMKEALPQLFEKHTERGSVNALLFDESILEVLKRTKELKNRGRTLKQIREELSALAGEGGMEGKVGIEGVEDAVPFFSFEKHDPMKTMLERENVLLRSQVELLQGLLHKAEERFDRLLPTMTATSSAAGTTLQAVPKRETLKSQLLLWLVEAVVVTAFASGFIFLIWFFAQKAFKL